MTSLNQNEPQSGLKPENDREISSVSLIAPVLKVINKLRDNRLLEDYAMGGGIAVLYYTDSVLTYNFDVICVFPETALHVGPSHVFEYLKNEGYVFGKEDRVEIEGIPVQFIPASQGLMEEALENAVNVMISGVETKILAVEYLVAIMLQLNRPKDRAKVDLLINNEEVILDASKLQGILMKYDLTSKWQRFKDAI